MTQTSLLTNFSILLLIWLAGWGLAFWLIKKGITYIDNYLITSFLFLSLSVLLIVLFWNRLEQLTRDFIGFPFFVLIAAFIVTVMVYWLCPRILNKPEELIAQYPEEFYLYMSFRYLVSKSFEVLFQQVFIVVLTLLLTETGLTLTGIVLVFLGVFGLLHLPLLRIIGKSFGMYYSIASCTLAGVSPILIIGVHYGFVYTYAAHWFFYTLAALLGWLCFGKAPRPTN